MKDLIYREDAVNAWKKRQATMATTGMFELLGDLEHNIPSAKLFRNNSSKETPVRPITNIVYAPHQPIVQALCGRCKQPLRAMFQKDNYCGKCGQRIGWELLQEEKE